MSQAAGGHTPAATLFHHPPRYTPLLQNVTPDFLLTVYIILIMRA